MAGLTLVALLSGALPAFAAEFSAKVVRITDGDSLRALHQQSEVEIRLEGIDCPEHGQAFGNRAKQATSELAFGKTVTVRPTGKDQYGRTLADIVLPDGTNLNQELVRLGYAWWFRKYSSDETLARLEAEARQAKRGLWADPKPVAPWEWRKEQRAAELPLSSQQVVPNGVAIAALLPNPAGSDEGNEQVVIRNATSGDVDLDRWSLRDRAGHVFWLAGKVSAGETLTVTITEPTMPLNNDGDEVVLIDGSGVARSRVAYAEGQARSGAWIEFGKSRGQVGMPFIRRCAVHGATKGSRLISPYDCSRAFVGTAPAAMELAMCR